MYERLPHLQIFLRHLQKIPYVASKNIYRIAEYFLQLSPDKRDAFIKTLLEAAEHVIPCSVCYAWKEKSQVCFYCTAPKRLQRLICVVETWHDLCAIERAGSFEGVFHILGGAISPLDGVNPEDLSINALLHRAHNPAVEEIILALNQTIEGEFTTTFISKKLLPFRDRIRVTTLSRGVPVGSTLEYMDLVTISKAVIERKPV